MDIANRVVEAMSKQGTKAFVAMCEALKEFDVIVTCGEVPVVAEEDKVPATVPNSENNTNLTNSDKSPEPCISASPMKEETSPALERPTRAPLQTWRRRLHRRAKRPTRAPLQTWRPTVHMNTLLTSSLLLLRSQNPLQSQHPKLQPGLSRKLAKASTKKSKGMKKASRGGIVDDDDWSTLEDRSDSDENLSDDTDEAFEGARLSESVRNRGRPAIKRCQKSEQKSKRMKTSKEEAMRLVLGTLVPVKYLKAVRISLAEAYTVLSAMPVLGSLTQADAPQWKRTRFVLLSKSRPTLLRITEVYPLTYVKECISGINAYRGSVSEAMRSSNTFGVKITGVGAIKEEDILTVGRWHSAFQIVEGMVDTIVWVRSTKYDRIILGSPFNDTVQVDIGAFANRLEELP
ncbi:hypothetical protein PR001_g22306 [Phytophthora rubi]|uniref:Uncharacterized protein n=2 Tax=Phytophthora rubi TaxID=129364 RepID=A0A6A3J7P9_9STRA|nr:hypothetical protein PR002_g22785 [Phytophthora rubi]KAE8987503.1 hypothetical protein PR001_g22306 [Phytophthora rubi]